MRILKAKHQSTPNLTCDSKKAPVLYLYYQDFSISLLGVVCLLLIFVCLFCFLLPLLSNELWSFAYLGSKHKCTADIHSRHHFLIPFSVATCSWHHCQIYWCRELVTIVVVHSTCYSGWMSKKKILYQWQCYSISVVFLNHWTQSSHKHVRIQM